MLDSLFSIVTLVCGTVLGFQFVMILLGLTDHGPVGGADGIGGGADGDFDFAGDGGDVAGIHGDVTHHDATWFYEVISIRTLSAAGTFFGLVGKTMLAYGHTPLASFVYAALAGIAALYGVYWLFKQVYRLQNAGNENVRRAIGLPATVYVPIPGARAGEGKVMFRLQDRTVEYLAVTNESTRLATGEKVTIVGIVNAGTVRVARQTQETPVEAPT